MSKIFLKLGNVMGSSTDPGHVQWIELLSCSFPPRRSAPAAPVPSSPGSRTIPWIELECSKSFDISSGALLKMTNDGSAADSAIVQFVDDDTGITNNMYLSEVMLTSFGTRQDPSNSVIEIFGLMCKFKPPDEKGKEVFSIFNRVTKRDER
jgi:type VI protein secretion system component Hcp